MTNIPLTPILLSIVIPESLFYLKIKPPATQNNLNEFPSLEKRVKIEKETEIFLFPSIGYGINSCYTVEYYEWKAPISEEYKGTHKLFHKEYWYVPTVDFTYLLNYSQAIYFKAKNDRLKNLTLNRSTANADPLPREAFAIHRISSSTKENHSGYQVRHSPNIALDWSASSDRPIDGEDYQVFYIPPFTRKEVLFVEYPSKNTMLPGNSIRPTQYPGF